MDLNCKRFSRATAWPRRFTLYYTTPVDASKTLRHLTNTKKQRIALNTAYNRYFGGAFETSGECETNYLQMKTTGERETEKRRGRQRKKQTEKRTRSEGERLRERQRNGQADKGRDTQRNEQTDKGRQRNGQTDKGEIETEK